MSDAVETKRHMDQWPEGVEGAHSPLHGYANASTMLEELSLSGFLTLRGKADDAQFARGVKIVLGLPLAGRLQSSVAGDVRLSWIAPDEWLIRLPIERCFEVQRQLNAQIKSHFAVANTSGAHTIIRLCCDHALEVLKKSTPYDVREQNFPIGKAVTSVLAKTQALFIRVGEVEWHIVVRRSFAHYVWDWLSDATSEYLD